MQEGIVEAVCLAFQTFRLTPLDEYDPILPGLGGDNLVLKALARTAPVVALWISLILLIPAPISAYNSRRKRRLLDNQKDLDGIRSLGWREFEELVGEAYRRLGYSVMENTGTGPDGGVDLVLKKDGNTILVQCKQWGSWKIGIKVVREMYGIMTAKHASGAHYCLWHVHSGGKKLCFRQAYRPCGRETTCRPGWKRAKDRCWRFKGASYTGFNRKRLPSMWRGTCSENSQKRSECRQPVLWLQSVPVVSLYARY